MRIAIDGSAWGWSRGFGRYTRELTRALARVGPADDLLLVIDPVAARRDDLPDIPRVVVPRVRGGQDVAAIDEWRSPRDLWRTARALSRGDGVVFPTHTTFVPVLPGRRAGLVVHDAIREADPGRVGASRAADLRWRAKSWVACRQATVIATPTRASARAIREQLPIGERPIVVLGAGADPIFSPERDPKAERGTARWVAPGSRFVLYVGGLGSHKRVPDLIRAFADLASQPGFADVLLVLAGSVEGTPAERAPVEAALEDLGPARSRVHRLGYVPDATLAALYRRAQCVALPAAVEGFGLPALEAMASGTSVVASRIPALVEVCGEAAEYFDDPAALPGVLGRLLGDPERRTALSHRGKARAAAFGWDAAARTLLEALSSP